MREKIFKIIEPTEPANAASSYYDKFMIICITLSIIPLCFKETNAAFVWIERTTVAIFILDYISRWVTADLKGTTHKKTAFLKYPFTPYAIIDLLSILPVFIPLNTSFKLLRLLRLAKAFRALRLLRYSKSMKIITSVIKKERKPLLAVCILAAGYILISALVMFQVEPDCFETFFDSIYWAMVTLTTVGYGDIYPVSDIGRIISMLSSFMGIAIVALPTGIITAGYMSELEKNK